MSIHGNNVKLSSFPVGDSDTNISTVIFGHRSGKLLAVGSEDGTIYIYAIGQMTSLLSSQCQTNAITALRFSNEENLLASGSRSGAVKICDLESQKVIHPGGHKTCIRSIEYFPSSNNYLATGAVDGTAKLWDPRRKGFIFDYKEHNGAINALKFSPDGRYLITASDDTAIRIWDVTAGKIIKAFQEHQGPVFTIEYHPKELIFASAGADRRIKFWDLEKMQFICETQMETSAIKCLAFEPINSNYILSGSNDTLSVHSREPIQLLDTIQMNWNNILDMTIHKDQLFGISALQNKVHISSINLSNLKTKQPVSSVHDYFPTKPKVSCIDASVLHNKHSQYQAMIVDKSKPSIADSVLIDNHVTRAASRQEVSAITRQTSSTVEVIPPPPAIVSTKPKTSQSISSPPQVNESEQSRSNEQIFTSLSKVNEKINSIQAKRMRSLICLINLSRTNPPQTSFHTIVASHDLSLKCFFLRFVVEKVPIRDWNLDLCTTILRAAHDLIISHYHWYNLIACQALEKVLTCFGKIIYDNVGAKSIGVDLSQQARRDKCQSCHRTLYEIRCLIEDRLKNPVDSSLKQTFGDVIRLLNTVERS